MLDWRQGGRVWCCCSHQVRSGGQGNRSWGQLRKENGLRVREEEREKSRMAPCPPSGQTGRANDHDKHLGAGFRW